MSRADILKLGEKAAAPEQCTHPTRGWTICLRIMSGAERDAYESGNYEMDDKSGRVKFVLRNARARLVARCLCDETGKRLFGDSEADFLGGMPGGSVFLDWVYDEARKLNCMTREEEERLEKNCEKTESGDCGSVSFSAPAAQSTGCNGELTLVSSPK